MEILLNWKFSNSHTRSKMTQDFSKKVKKFLGRYSKENINSVLLEAHVKSNTKSSTSTHVVIQTLLLLVVFRF